MRTVLVVGWMIAFAVAFAVAVVTRRSVVWAAVAVLALPAVYVVLAVAYGTH